MNHLKIISCVGYCSVTLARRDHSTKKNKRKLAMQLLVYNLLSSLFTHFVSHFAFFSGFSQYFPSYGLVPLRMF